MSDDGHDLHAEFPHARDALHRLKTGNAHFATIAGRYSDVNHEVRRIEEGLDAASDVRLEELKKKRLALLDEVAALIAREEVA